MHDKVFKYGSSSTVGVFVTCVRYLMSHNRWQCIYIFIYSGNGSTTWECSYQRNNQPAPGKVHRQAADEKTRREQKMQFVDIFSSRVSMFETTCMTWLIMILILCKRSDVCMENWMQKEICFRPILLPLAEEERTDRRTHDYTRQDPNKWLSICSYISPSTVSRMTNNFSLSDKATTL